MWNLYPLARFSVSFTFFVELDFGWKDDCICSPTSPGIAEVTPRYCEERVLGDDGVSSEDITENRIRLKSNDDFE